MDAGNSSTLNHRELRAALARARVPNWRLAARIGVSPSALSAYLNGKRRAPADLARRIEKALRLSPGSLDNDSN